MTTSSHLFKISFLARRHHRKETRVEVFLRERVGCHRYRTIRNQKRRGGRMSYTFRIRKPSNPSMCLVLVAVMELHMLRSDGIP